MCVCVCVCACFNNTVHAFILEKSIYIYIFSRRFIQSDLQAIHCFVSICVPWELNPQPFAPLTQCSTTEPQEHGTYKYALLTNNKLNNILYICIIYNYKFLHLLIIYVLNIKIYEKK